VLRKWHQRLLFQSLDLSYQFQHLLLIFINDLFLPQNIFEFMKQLVRPSIWVTSYWFEIVVWPCGSERRKLCNDVLIWLRDARLRFLFFWGFAWVESVFNYLHFVVVALSDDAIWLLHNNLNENAIIINSNFCFADRGYDLLKAFL
jgi:hypothetical protein